MKKEITQEQNAVSANTAETINQSQINEWKKKYGEIFKIQFEDGKEVYLKKPDRKVLSFAMTKMQTNPLGFAEVILNQCFLGGDADVKGDDSYFFGASAQLEGLMEVKTAELKKL
ncbi:hypothetical protein EQP59_07140 [Ornithobacterium rhinotracheale]|uniref:Uncharacterized protein n=1 Tax=Ornithobacterium rhinotracheale TaxID=28251 RepID=A0A3R5XU06_ORNRH|nr:hypothetical protein [Ornithobacterium rhinotracheale]MRI64530.1 hypothetical protein [Ornithobacterium rhinotracheale]MRJ11506.1 hypothetical protein [Ornithobacterium rhinotracheale]QAR31120.1 hypothetical protein EQP59_07140 [Ornithobacterium rhinotracheale]